MPIFERFAFYLDNTLEYADAFNICAEQLELV